MKYILPLALMASLAFCASAQASPGFKTKADAPKQELLLKSEATPELSVFFRHKDHKDIDCMTCHHKQNCQVCHFGPAESAPTKASCSEAGCHPDMGRSQEPMSRFMAIHKRDSLRSCFGCHTSTGIYEGCTPCHNDRKVKLHK